MLDLCHCTQLVSCTPGTLGSSFLAFPQSLDIIFVYLTMYLIDALSGQNSCQFQIWLRAPDGGLLDLINIAGKVH